MTVDLEKVLPIAIYVALLVLIIVIIVLVIRLMKTLGKVDLMLDDVNRKMKRVDGLFDLIDKATDYVATIGDKIVGGITNAIHFITRRKKGKKKNE